MYYDALVVEVETFLLLLWSLKKIIPPFQKKSLNLVIFRQIIKNFIRLHVMLHNQTHANVLDTYIVQYACTVYILSTKLKESQELSRSSTIFFSLRAWHLKRIGHNYCKNKTTKIHWDRKCFECELAEGLAQINCTM